MIGERLYLFHCGCIAYELKKKINGAWVCPEHYEAVKEIHSFCEECGLHIIDGPMGQPRKYCNYPTRIINGRGKETILKGCAEIRQRERARRYWLANRSTSVKKLKKSKILKKYQRVKSIKAVMKSCYPVPAIPKTPMLDRFWRQLREN